MYIYRFRKLERQLALNKTVSHTLHFIFSYGKNIASTSCWSYILHYTLVSVNWMWQIIVR